VPCQLIGEDRSDARYVSEPEFPHERYLLARLDDTHAGGLGTTGRKLRDDPRCATPDGDRNASVLRYSGLHPARRDSERLAVVESFRTSHVDVRFIDRCRLHDWTEPFENGTNRLALLEA
jgi:hypothetical protein